MHKCVFHFPLFNFVSRVCPTKLFNFQFNTTSGEIEMRTLYFQCLFPLKCWLRDRFTPHYGFFFTESRNILIINVGLLLQESILDSNGHAYGKKYNVISLLWIKRNLLYFLLSKQHDLRCIQTCELSSCVINNIHLDHVMFGTNLPLEFCFFLLSVHMFMFVMTGKVGLG